MDGMSSLDRRYDNFIENKLNECRDSFKDPLVFLVCNFNIHHPIRVPGIVHIFKDTTSSWYCTDAEGSVVLKMMLEHSDVILKECTLDELNRILGSKEYDHLDTPPQKLLAIENNLLVARLAKIIEEKEVGLGLQAFREGIGAKRIL